MKPLVLPPAALPLLPTHPCPTAEGKLCVQLPSGRASDNCADVSVDEFVAALKNRKPTTVAAVQAMHRQTGRTFRDAGERREAWQRYLAWLEETNAPLHAEYVSEQGWLSRVSRVSRVVWCFG